MIDVPGGAGINGPPGSYTGAISAAGDGTSPNPFTDPTLSTGHNTPGLQISQRLPGAGVGGYHGFTDLVAVSCRPGVGPGHGGYDWSSEENKLKWKGIFAGPEKEKEAPLAKVLDKALIQLHYTPHVVPKHEALDYVESLLLKILEMLTASCHVTSRPIPTSKSDIEVLFNCKAILRI